MYSALCHNIGLGAVHVSELERWEFPLLAHRAVRSLCSAAQWCSRPLYLNRFLLALKKKKKKGCVVFIRCMASTLPLRPELHQQKVCLVCMKGAPYICMYFAALTQIQAWSCFELMVWTVPEWNWMVIRWRSNTLKLFCTPSKILTLTLRSHALLRNDFLSGFLEHFLAGTQRLCSASLGN